MFDNTGNQLLMKAIIGWQIISMNHGFWQSCSVRAKASLVNLVLKADVNYGCESYNYYLHMASFYMPNTQDVGQGRGLVAHNPLANMDGRF